MATKTNAAGDLGDAARKLNEKIDCEDLALRLGLERPGAKGNFRSPHHPDKAPSVSVYQGKDGLSRWQDHSLGSGPGTGGGPVDMLMWFSNIPFAAAVRELAGMYGVEIDRPKAQAREEQTLAEFIADKCRAAARDGANDLFDYLQGRGIDKKPIEDALAKATLGINRWHSDKVERGQVMWGGDAAAFIVRDRVTSAVVAVDTRYFNAADNGGQKTGCQGEKMGFAWCSDWRRLEAARTVYIVESPINALSIESCFLPGCAALATRGTGNVSRIDWTFLRGKSVVICFDNDKPMERGPDMGYCPGLKAAWQLHEILTGLDISCLMVDQGSWFEDAEHKKPINDINDFLKAHGNEKTTLALKRIEEWMIPGLPAEGRREGRARLYFPSHDWFAYTRYRVQPDFTRTIDKQTKDEETGETKYSYHDVCGFRIAAVSRVQIASPTSTMTGDRDNAPTTVFALSVQTARHGPKLLRRVVEDEKLHNLDGWKKLGPVFAPPQFSRLVNIWERAAGIGAREAVNFVGLAWRDGKPVVNEGPDCFFHDPRQQCPYHALTFPGGAPRAGAEVLQHYQATFKSNAAAIPLVWALGAHLKAFLGFWPHFVMQAEKETGKSTLVKRLERTLAMTMFSRQSIQTEFRLLTSISYTSHPVGWEEISAGRQEIIDKAVAQLQESYQYTHTRRGADMMDFLLCAPVLLAGEDVPVDGLTGKVVRTQLTMARRGPLMPEDLPVFPLKTWLQYLVKTGKEKVQQLHADVLVDFRRNCVAASGSGGSERMVNNYAALGAAWHLLCEFAGMPVSAGGFLGDLTAEMNSHITETVSDRQPWALIVDKLLSEIASHQFRYPFKFDTEDEVPVLLLRTGHVMAHLAQSNTLRAFWDRMTIKSDRALKRQLVTAGVLLMDPNKPGEPLHVERTVRGSRVSHMVALSRPQLEQFGLHAVIPEEPDPAFEGGSTVTRFRGAA
ncbi:toprim domain-containing protein [Aquabacterium sp.]|uniref:toprim domain-containing protein n=1 Tax=Aquabacterium sp. TaxID=1872578 RepID=UPI0025B84388|nr:toprim domain-containing protein [Aquabacterium sp.]